MNPAPLYPTSRHEETPTKRRIQSHDNIDSRDFAEGKAVAGLNLFLNRFDSESSEFAPKFVILYGAGIIQGGIHIGRQF